MVHAWQKRRAKYLAVGRNAAYAHATESGTMVATLAADENVAMTFAPRAMIGERNF